MIIDWVKKHDPASMPYRPGTPRTGDRFGLRQHNIGSPVHLGDDRGASPPHIVMPFNGWLSWSMTEGAWGSTARLIPGDNRDCEIQIAHTVRADGGVDEINEYRTRGETLRIIAGDIGLSRGVHTHTEFVIRYSESDYHALARNSELRASYNDSEPWINNRWILSHADNHGWDPDDLRDRVIKQMHDWRIIEIRDGVCVRDALPAYRDPWGTPVIIADPMRWLQI